MKTIVINATAISPGGGLTILEQFVKNIPDDGNRYILFTHSSVNIESTPANLRIVKKDVKSFFPRFYWDAYGLKHWIKQHIKRADAVVSLQNTSVNLDRGTPNFIYYHQPLPLYDYKWSLFRSAERSLWLYKNIYPFFVRLFINEKTEVFVQIKFIRDRFKKKYKLPENKIHLIAPEINLPEIVPCRNGIDKTCINLFFPASVVIYKNHKVLFEALHRLDKEGYKAVLYLTCLENDFPVTWQAGFKNVKICFLGKILHSEVLAFLQEMNALVFPSYLETFGLPLLEAAMLGIPVIAADLPYAHDVIENYEGGRFVKYDDAGQWAEQIKAIGEIPPVRYPPYRMELQASWEKLFEIIKDKI